MTQHEQTITGLREEVARLKQLLTNRPSSHEASGTGQTAEPVLANDRLRNETDERQQAIEALNNREKLLQLYFDRMPLGCIVWDREFRVTAWNPAAERIFGFAAAEALGRRPFGFIVPLQLEENLASILERLSVGDLTAHSINENLTRDGRTIICEWTNTPLIDDQGKMIGAISMAQDITERTRAEEELKNEKALLRCLIDSASDLIFIKDINGAYLGCNKASEEFVGMPEHEQIGKTDFDLFDPEIAEAVMRDDRQILNDRMPRRFEEWVPTADGRKVLLDTVKAPFYAPGGECLGLVGVCRDITGRKRMEASLRDSEERYRALVETTNDWIWEVDDQGRYTYASPRIQDLLGYTPEEVIGRTPFDFMTEEEARRVGDLFAEIVAERRPFTSLENVNLHRDGKKVVLETSGAPVFDANGEFRGYRGIDRDITERKQESEILQARLRLLEYSFSHTLAELLQATLDEAEKITGSLIGFYHFLEEDQKTLSLQAWSTRNGREILHRRGSGEPL